MELRAEQLKQNIKELAPLYLISGDEVLLKQEACDLIRSTAKQQGYSERESFTVNKQFDWSAFYNSYENLSLFSTKKLIELNFNDKPNKAATTALLNYSEQISPDNIVLISMPKLDGNNKKAKWYKTLTTVGVSTTIWPLNKQQFPNWLKQRFQTVNLNIEPTALEIICQRTEGNLLAAHQEVEKLKLIYNEGIITAEQVLQATGESYRYDIFGLVDTCLQADIKQVTKILNSLKEEGTEAILVLWAITRELRTLLKMVEMLRKGNDLESTLRKFAVWEKRKPLLRNYFKRCKTSKIYQQLQLAARIDQQIKGVQPGSPWESLLVLCINFAGGDVH